eukprot:TRINITY_DN3812_c0_g1_i1.p1 TRINITY_DN3812_c0_g1~~TRINITY_DN3812_c0_g1_i1.p1  ORF type:complete len:1969 (-),score=370.42 TRINITY_DN3812_c0_g1_i1:184-6090(-)
MCTISMSQSSLSLIFERLLMSELFHKRRFGIVFLQDLQRKLQIMLSITMNQKGTNDDICSEIPGDLNGAADMLIRQLLPVEHVILAIASMIGAEFTREGVEDVLAELQRENHFSLQNIDLSELTTKSFHLLCTKLGMLKIVHVTEIVSAEKDRHRHSFVINTRSYPTTTTAMLGSLRRRMSSLQPQDAQLVPAPAFQDKHLSPRSASTHQLSASNLNVDQSISNQAASPRNQQSFDINGSRSPTSEAHAKGRQHCIYGVSNEIFRDRAIACLSPEDLKKVSEAVLEYFSVHHSGRRSCWFLHSQDFLSCTVHCRNESYARKIMVQTVDFLGTATIRGMAEYGWWLSQIYRMKPDGDDDVLNHAQYGRWLAETLSEVGHGQIEDAISGISRGLELVDVIKRPKQKFKIAYQMPILFVKHLSHWLSGGRDLLELPSLYSFPPDMRLPLPLGGLELPDETRLKKYEALLLLDRYAEYLQMTDYHDGIESFHNAVLMVNLAEQLGNCTAILARSYARLGSECHRRGQRWIARRYFRVATSVAKRSGDSPALLFVFCYVGTAAIEIASWTAVQESLEIAMSLYGKRSSAASGVHFISPFHERYARLSIAVAAEYRGRFDEAAHFYQELTEMASPRRWNVAEGDDFNEAAHEDLPPERAWCRIWGCRGRAEVLLIQGQVSEPLRLLQIAYEQAKKHSHTLPHEMLHICPVYAAAMFRSGKPHDEIEYIVDQSGIPADVDIIRSSFGYALLQSYSFAVDVYLELWRAAKDKHELGIKAFKALRLMHKFATTYDIGQARYSFWVGKYNLLSHHRNAALIEWKASVDHARRMATPFDEGLASLELALHFTHSELRRGVNEGSDLKHGVSASIHYLQTAQRIFRQTNVPQLELIAQHALSKEYELVLDGPTDWSRQGKSGHEDNSMSHNYTSYENIGRDREVSMIKAHLQKIVEKPSRPEVVILEGDQGMGKSHIIQELRVAAEIMKVPTIYGQADFRDHRAPFFSWRSILLYAFGIDTDFANRSEEKSHNAVMNFLRSLQIPPAYACLLNGLLSVNIPDDEGILQMPKARRTDILFEMIFRVIVARFSQEGKDVPTSYVIIMEDVQSMDEPSWGLLMRLIGIPLTSIVESNIFDEALVPDLNYLNLLMVLTARRVGDPPAGYRVLEEIVLKESGAEYSISFIRLSSIQRSQTKQILMIILGDISEDVVNYVHEMSSGNPMFVREITNFLSSTKSLHQFPSGQWHLIQQLTTLPDFLKSALSERMDSLSSVQRDLLGFCAVFHKAGESSDQVSKIALSSSNFSAPIRFLVKAYQNADAYEDAGYAPSEEDEAMMLNIIKPDLEKLNYLGLLRPTVSLMFSGAADEEVMEEPGYMINHSMLRDWCYRLLNSQERKRLHHLAARWIEKTAGSNITVVHPSFLAFHFGKAGEDARSMYYLELAAYRYRKKGMFLQMASVMAEALALGDQEDNPDLFRRAVWEIAYSEANLGLGRLGRCARHVMAALQLFHVRVISSSKFQMKLANWKLRSRFQNSSRTKLPVTIEIGENDLWYNYQQSIDSMNPEFVRDLFGEGGLSPAMLVVKGLQIMAQGRRYRTQVNEYLATTFALMNILQQSVQFPSDHAMQSVMTPTVRSIILSHYAVASFAHKSLLPVEISSTPMNGPADVLLMVTHAEFLITQTRFEECLNILRSVLRTCEQFNLDHEWDRSMLLLATVHRFVGHLSLCTQVYEDLVQKIRHVGYHHVESSAIWGQMEALIWRAGVGSATTQIALAEEDLESDDLHVGLLQAAVSALIALRLDDQASCFQKLIIGYELLETYSSKRWYSAMPIISLSTLADMTWSLLEMESMAHRMRPGALDNTRQRVLQEMMEAFANRLTDMADAYPCAKTASLLWKGAVRWMRNQEERAIEMWNECIEESTRMKMLPDLARAHFEIGRRAPSNSEARTENLSKSVRLYGDMNAGYWATRAQQELTAVPIVRM